MDQLGAFYVKKNIQTIRAVKQAQGLQWSVLSVLGHLISLLQLTSYHSAPFPAY